MERDEDKSTMDERLTGVRDPKDPDGLLTVEQAEDAAEPEQGEKGVGESSDGVPSEPTG
ncbi:hypothetical protein OSC27_14165 [Microbacterium sp. STN6]|uniref:hypothetical protein n=1 Tax=Microbacterium sp. STN6 TaxID=2995588 RepID=UPI0022609D91|nr:hypothetical protein [Microbacterium sp. STN6]MCX7523417.1 hypothetical protein [Microbacterium sp. STN6]